jgi:hypothetical protein
MSTFMSTFITFMKTLYIGLFLLLVGPAFAFYGANPPDTNCSDLQISKALNTLKTKGRYAFDIQSVYILVSCNKTKVHDVNITLMSEILVTKHYKRNQSHHNKHGKRDYITERNYPPTEAYVKAKDGIVFLERFGMNIQFKDNTVVGVTW